MCFTTSGVTKASSGGDASSSNVLKKKTISESMRDFTAGGKPLRQVLESTEEDTRLKLLEVSPAGPPSPFRQKRSNSSVARSICRMVMRMSGREGSRRRRWWKSCVMLRNRSNWMNTARSSSFQKYSTFWRY